MRDRTARNETTLITLSGASAAVMRAEAERLAREMGLGIYRVDLSQVVSKYIGETEKNLSRVFGEAERGGAVLLFDEADALFGKRGTVASAGERYSDRELGSLAETLARHRGVIIALAKHPVPQIESKARLKHLRITYPPGIR